MTEHVKVLNEEDRDEIEALLLGRRVVSAEEGKLVLDDGVVIEALGHEGGCSCGAGDYDLAVLNRVDNVITRVDFDYHPGEDEQYQFDWETGAYRELAPRCEHPDNPPAGSHTGFYRIFVYAEQELINLVQFNGTDGNGYYGTGFELRVRVPS